MKNFKTIILTSSITVLLTTISFALLFKYFAPQQNKNNVIEKVSINSEKPLDLKPIDYNVYDKNTLNNRINFERKNIITETVKRVSNAVVGINVTQIQQIRPYWSSDPFFREFFGDQFINREIKSLGSGYIISPDGYIVTNDHVAGQAQKIIITMTDGRQFSAKIIGTDETTDICLLKIDAHNLPYIKFSDNKMIIGEWAIALGNPFGLFEINDKPTVTVGVISSLGMNLGAVQNRYYLNMIQTDAAINGGNSGGPLVNVLGELIGMNTIIYSPNAGSGSVGVGFAIPANKIKKIISELKEDGKIDRNFWTGLRIQNIDDSIAKYYKLKNKRGVIVTYVQPNSPAEKAGLKIADIITKVGSYVVNNDRIMIGALQDYRTGENVTISILRDNEKLEKKLRLEKIK